MNESSEFSQFLYTGLEDPECTEDEILRLIKVAVPTLCGTLFLIILTITVGIVSCCRRPASGNDEPDLGLPTDEDNQLPWQALLGLSHSVSTATDSTVVDALDDAEEMQVTVATGNHNSYLPLLTYNSEAEIPRKLGKFEQTNGKFELLQTNAEAEEIAA